MIEGCFVVLFLLTLTSCIDDSIYRTCEESDFCNRLRFKESGRNFVVRQNSALYLSNGVSLLILNQETNKYLDLNITIFEETVVRVTASERDIYRYNIPHVLQTLPQTTGLYLDDQSDRTIIRIPGYQVIIWHDDCKIDIYNLEYDRWVFTFNDHVRLTMESTDDSKAFAFDVYFPFAIRAYGIPEHSDRFGLRTTSDTGDPFHLYNAYTPGYNIDSRIGLNGAVPILYGHGLNHTIGVFLANAAEQWVDIINEQNGITAYFMVEDGALDVYVLLGPTPENVAVQYTDLTGVAPLPQLWALGYHHSSWNYVNQEDVKGVVAEFDNHEIPIDVIWGTREIQDGYRYFTWNPDTFSDSIGMLNNLSATHRKFITQVDPHYKVDSNYFVYAEGRQNGYFIKNADGTDFVDQCLPGESSWVDFFNEDASDWYEGLFSYSRFSGTNSALGGIVNDLNEPAVFNTDSENTINRNVLHYGDIPHQRVHNMYGFTQTRATYNGLMARDNRELRPFVISRSFFAGSQRYGGVWTGDNIASWEHLRMSYSMCLTISLAGISMCGADIGGFLGDPDSELLTRWYQAGAWFPFFRAHSSNGTAAREPYLFESVVQNRIRTAIQRRYEHLPLFYTLFYEHSKYGTPVIRPTFYEYPEDPNVANIDTQIYVGRNVLVKPVEEPNVTRVTVFFAGGREQLWYDIDTPLLYRGIRWLSVNVTMDQIPVFYKGGSIIFKKTIVRRNTYEMENDPYTVYLFLDNDHRATGTIYQDDFHSFSYERNVYSYFLVTFEDENISMVPIDENMPDHDANLVIDSYVLYRPPRSFRNSESDEPVHVEPIVITKTADGRNIRDLRFNAQTKTTFKLLQ